MKPDFDRCEKVATRLLLKQDIESLYVDVLKLKFEKSIFFNTIQNYCAITGARVLDLPGGIKALSDGCTLKKQGTFLVLCNQDALSNRERLNWTLAHEVGHIYLGHETDGETEEIEAHWFAAQLLMQENVLRDMAHINNGLDVWEVSEYFRVSFTAAQKRIHSLTKKCMWFSGEEEIRLLERYRPFEYAALRLSFAKSV